MDIELMEKKLYDACVEGDVETLEALMREDKLILARLSLFSCFNQTPLHLACMLGHFDFAKSLLSYKHDFASRLDSQGCSPLHLASANGYANIVKLLLQHDGSMCRVPDEDGRTPLQLAVMNGQHESVKSTVQDLSDTKDDKGNTILHSAIVLKRMQIIKYLLKSTSHVLDVNAANENGLTALDMIEQMPKDAKTMEIKELLISASALRAKEIETATSTILMGAAANQNAAANTTGNNIEGGKTSKKPKKGIFRKTLEKSDKTLLVAASVIAAMAYQAAISPPGGVASVNAYTTINDSDPKEPRNYYLKAGASLLAYFYPGLRDRFWISNTIAFMAALSVIFLYVSGASPKRRFFIWLIRLGMWITLTAMVAAYVFAVLATTPSNDINRLFTSTSPTLDALLIGLYAWLALLCLSILVLVCRFLSYVVRTIFKAVKRIFRAIFKAVKRIFRKKKNTSQDADATFRRTPNANIV